MTSSDGRAQGEKITDESLIEAHPDLMPELAEELRFVHLIASAKSEARRPPREGLHVRCPHCHHPVRVVEEMELFDVGMPLLRQSFQSRRR